MRKILAAFAAASALASGGANAATFSYFTDFTAGVGPEWTIVGADVNSHDAGILGQLSNGAATLSQISVGSGAGGFQFDLLGFRSVDGFNCCTDFFSLRLNGALVFQGAFNLGGGGSDGVLVNTNSAVVSGAGASRHIVLPFHPVTGLNTFAFDYGPMQGFGDEAWGLDNVSFQALVTAPRSGGVPEPAAWGLMLLGFGGLGATLRRRRAALAGA